MFHFSFASGQESFVASSTIEEIAWTNVGELCRKEPQPYILLNWTHIHTSSTHHDRRARIIENFPWNCSILGSIDFFLNSLLHCFSTCLFSCLILLSFEPVLQRTLAATQRNFMGFEPFSRHEARTCYNSVIQLCLSPTKLLLCLDKKSRKCFLACLMPNSMAMMLELLWAHLKCLFVCLRVFVFWPKSTIVGPHSFGRVAAVVHNSRDPGPPVQCNHSLSTYVRCCFVLNAGMMFASIEFW